MNQITQLLTEIEIRKIEKFLNKYIVNNTQFTILVFKYNDCTVSVYTSKKMLIQGKESLKVYKELVQKNIVIEKEIKIKDSKIIKKQNHLIDIKSNIIGCDEVGVGDFFGGLVACACFVNKTDEKTLKDIGVKDSKLLNDDQMISIFNQISSLVTYSCKVINPEEYNNLYDKYNNSHILKTKLHNDALVDLTSNIKIKYKIVMDEYSSEKNYNIYLDKINPSLRINIDIFTHHAETKYIAVACASIIARVYFLKQIDTLSKKYNERILLGNNDNVFNLAKKLYNISNDKLNCLVKKHFITYSKLKGEQ